MHGRRPALQNREKNINKNRGRRERLVEELKTDMEEIGEGQERIKETRQKCEEIESERQKLKQQSMNISKQSDCNVIRVNLMLSILEARQDNSFVQADERTQLLRLTYLYHGSAGGVTRASANSIHTFLTIEKDKPDSLAL
ncbi:hypothetical protein POTOM_032166 [Populus tomentosa]|uniref:Uncharacterized protein n=1 Tax=Populus tomentosa TaxID=118781 RepID=A0A8X7Z9L4_POPTO|nr:hypothetical protein POTOM_032166 [Populus tomentosa]